MTEFFIKQHKLVNLILVGIIAVGIYYFVNGQKEGFPNIGLDEIFITTPYPGASSKDIDSLITSKIEDAIESVDGIKDINASSSEGLSFIKVTADTTSSGLDLKEIERKIKDEVDLIKKDLPADLDSDPVIKAISFIEAMPTIQVLISGKENFNELKRITEKFREQVNNINGVSKTGKFNFPKTQVWVSVDPAKLKKYEIDINEVVTAIKSANINTPSGTIKNDNEEILIKTINPIENIADINNIVIRGNDNFQIIRLKDVAHSSINPEDLSSVVESDGQFGIGVTVYKSLNGDIIRVATAVKKLIKEYQNLYPNLNIFYLNDLSFYVERRLNVLTNNASIGLILVFLCLIIFFEFRITIWTTLGIPVALCFSIIVCYLIGLTLNLMSMFGFIIVLGMLVDDAIIVSENIYQKYEKGMPLMEASILGSKEMVIPVLAILGTSMAAFLPLMTLPGIFGKVLGIIPQVVVIALFASFVESFWVLPGHIAYMKDRNLSQKKDQKKLQKKFTESPYNITAKITPVFTSLLSTSKSQEIPDEKNKKPPQEKRVWFIKLRNVYIKTLSRLTLRPVLNSFLIVIGCATIVAGLGSRIPFVFFPGQTQSIIVDIEVDRKSPLKKTQLVLRKLEKDIRKQVGNDAEEIISTAGESRVTAKTYAGDVSLTLKPVTEKSPSQINKLIEGSIAKIPEIKSYKLSDVKGGPPPGNPVEVILFFNNISSLSKIKNLAEKIQTYVSSISNTSSESISYEEGKEGIIINPDPIRATALGVSLEKIALTASSSFKGLVSTTINSFSGIDEEVEVVVKLDEEKINNTSTDDSISDLEIKNRVGKNIKLESFANISQIVNQGNISKENGQYYIKITAQLENQNNIEYTSEKINQIIKDKIPEWEKEMLEGEVKLGGAQKEQVELIDGAIKAGLLSIFGVLVVLVAIFKSYLQPFIIMSVLPFISVGVVIGLFINNVPIGLMPLLGIVALTGVVVNDSIVLVDLINKKRLKNPHQNLREIVVESGGQRLRAIMMTTITTMVGLIPIAYGIGGEEPFIAPMATTFLWGMLFSSLMILFLIPNFYLIIERLTVFFYKLFGKKHNFHSDN